jgi:hypothetical protein
MRGPKHYKGVSLNKRQITKRARRDAAHEALLYQDVECLQLLSSARTLLQGAIANKDLIDVPAVVAGEWLNALMVWANRTGVHLDD